MEAVDEVEVEVIMEDKIMDAKDNNSPPNATATRAALFTKEQNTSGANAL